MVSWFLFGTVCQDEEQLGIIRKGYVVYLQY